jgi:osmotically-inducible protein OsmY
VQESALVAEQYSAPSPEEARSQELLSVEALVESPVTSSVKGTNRIRRLSDDENNRQKHSQLKRIIMKSLSLLKPLQLPANFLLILFMLSFLGCASTAKHEGTGEYIDDSVITTKVKAEIFKDDSLKSSEINVETFKGVVQLSGFVNSKADINRAVEVTRNVKGVTGVRNDMRVK